MIAKHFSSVEELAAYARPWPTREQNKDLRFNHDKNGALENTLSDALHGKPLTQDHERARELAAKQLVSDMAQENIVRCRVKSDCDGDWDYTKRYEDKPFIDSVRRVRNTTQLKILVNMACGGGTSEEELAEFCISLWAVCDLLESRGYQTEVVLCTQSTNVLQNNTQEVVRISVCVKDLQSYTEPTRLIGAMTETFYRKALWCARFNLCDELGTNCNLEIGTPNKITPSDEHLSINLDDGARGLQLKLVDLLKQLN